MPGKLKNSEFYSYSDANTDDNFNKQVIDFVDNNLVGNIFHITSKERLHSIQSSGFLKAISEHNTFSSQSKSCYGKQNKWVCLFDFRFATNEQIEDSCQGCLWNLLTGMLIKPVALMMHQDIYSEIKFQEEIKTYSRNQVIPGLHVPDTECWYPGNVPYKKTDVIETNFKV